MTGFLWRDVPPLARFRIQGRLLSAAFTVKECRHQQRSWLTLGRDRRVCWCWARTVTFTHLTDGGGFGSEVTSSLKEFSSDIRRKRQEDSCGLGEDVYKPLSAAAKVKLPRPTSPLYINRLRSSSASPEVFPPAPGVGTALCGVTAPVPQRALQGKTRGPLSSQRG